MSSNETVADSAGDTSPQIEGGVPECDPAVDANCPLSE